MNYSKNKKSAANIIKNQKIKNILNEPKNHECFECSQLNPEFISLNNGIFLCRNCAKNHLHLPKIISNITQNNLNNLSPKGIQYLYYGGNRKLIEFLNLDYKNLNQYIPSYFYQTYAMDYYRKNLEYLIEGGIKPIKPSSDKAYELITQTNNNNGFDFNNENENEVIINKFDESESKNTSIIKSDSFIKINLNSKLFPKIKPIVGTRNELNVSKSVCKSHNLSICSNNQDLNLTSFKHNNLNYLNNSLKDECYSKRRLNTSESDFQCRYYSHYKNNYDTDENIEDFNTKVNDKDINDQINDLSYVNEINERNKKRNNINNIVKLKKQISQSNISNIEDSNIKVLKIKHNSTKKSNNNRIYSRPLYLNTFQNCYNNKKHYFKNLFIKVESNKYNDINNKEGKPLYINTEYLNNSNKYQPEEKYIFNLDEKPNKYMLTENPNSLYYNNRKASTHLNNINNNIIINRNLNVFYNDNSFQKIFRKKALGNSFSISEKKKKKQKYNHSTEKIKKTILFEANDEIVKLKKNINNELRKKMCNKIKEKKESNINNNNNDSTFIKVNKKNKANK
jgi:ADP-ribosylation factor GTPase-activating protein 1